MTFSLLLVYHVATVRALVLIQVRRVAPQTSARTAPTNRPNKKQPVLFFEE
jgi:hypothetical protein